MNEKPAHDEGLLIDYLLDRCSQAVRNTVEARLADDAKFRALRDDLANTFAALELAAAPDVPDDLADRTLARIASARQADAIRTRRELTSATRPTFSLKELGAMAAAAIVMAIIFIPWARQAHDRALQNRCSAQVGQIGTGIKNYALENNGSLPRSHASPVAWLPGRGRESVSNSAGLFRLVKGHHTPASVFQCPADPQAAGKVFRLDYDMTDFPSHKFISYSYQYALGPRSLSRTSSTLLKVAGEMAVLADRNPAFEDGKFKAEFISIGRPSSRNHGRAGHSVLYFEGTVKWQEQATVGVNGDNIFLVQGRDHYDGTEAPASETDSFLLPAWSGSTEGRK